MPLVSTRKRVTPAGRGAHAIYLPKAWLDAWSPEQREASEIDLVSLDEHLILTPVHGPGEAVAALDSDAPDDLVRLLLSAYVSGHRAFAVTRPEGFTDAQLVEARRFLRLLDERLDIEWADDRIRWTRDTSGPQRHTVGTHLDDLLGKVLEAAHSLAELLEFFPHNARRALHAIHFLTAIERDDIQRVKNQVYRQVARFQVPAERVADIELLLLGTHTLARMGKLLVETASTIGDHLGVPRDRLHYPPELLERDLATLPAPGAVFRGFLDQARRDLRLFIDLLTETRRLFADDGPDPPLDIDGRVALALSRRAESAHAAVAGHLMRRVAEAWGPRFVEEDPAAIYCVVKTHVHVQDLLEELRVLADRVTDFRLAETLETHA